MNVDAKMLEGLLFERALLEGRPEEMFICRQLGMTFKAIGARYGVTPERVRQILKTRDRRVRCLEGRSNAVFGEMDRTAYAMQRIAAAAAIVMALGGCGGSDEPEQTIDKPACVEKPESCR